MTTETKKTEKKERAPKSILGSELLKQVAKSVMGSKNSRLQRELIKEVANSVMNSKDERLKREFINSYIELYKFYEANKPK